MLKQPLLGGIPVPAGLQPLQRQLSRWAWRRPMSYQCSSSNHAGLVAVLQAEHGLLRSPDVKGAFTAVDRGLFAPNKEMAYRDQPLSIGHGATISAPHMHANCAELLREHLRPGARALDIGSGTGYLTAIFAQMVGPTGQVTGVEHVPELAAKSRVSLDEVPLCREMQAAGSLQIHAGDGFKGWPARGPYAAIHVGAAAESIPRALVDQLAEGGRMIIPVGPEGQAQTLQIVDKGRGPGASITTQDAMGVAYVPLTTLERQLGTSAVWARDQDLVRRVAAVLRVP